MIKLTHSEFINKAQNVHGIKYEYPDRYITARRKINIICLEHGVFYQVPYSHLRGNGCPKCSKLKIITYIDFVNKAQKIHGTKYDYPNEYINNIYFYKTKVKIICKKHGTFYQKPNNHITRKQKCPKCGGTKKLITNEFIQKSRRIHGTKYEYPNEYVNAHTKLKIICKQHGAFYQLPADHTNKGYGCQKCSNIRYSYKGVSWINKIMDDQNIFIQHAENKGEYRIPGTRYKADGYCEANNTIYEFYGDVFHGDPNLFKEDEQCHPFNDKTAKVLYINTINREQEIKDLGYNLITIWESYYDNSASY